MESKAIQCFMQHNVSGHLHLLVVFLQQLTVGKQLLIRLWHVSGHLIDGKGGSNTSYHIFTLSIHQVLTVEFVGTIRRITSEEHTFTMETHWGQSTVGVMKIDEKTNKEYF